MTDLNQGDPTRERLDVGMSLAGLYARSDGLSCPGKLRRTV